MSGGGKGGKGPEPTGETFQGAVKSVSEKYGFIDCDDVKAAYGGDCFVPGYQLDGYGKGDPVQFTLGINKEGKPQAIEITALGPMTGKACGKGAKAGCGAPGWKGGWDDGKGGGWDKGGGKGDWDMGGKGGGKCGWDMGGKGKGCWGKAGKDEWGGWGADPWGADPWGGGGDAWGADPWGPPAMWYPPKGKGKDGKGDGKKGKGGPSIPPKPTGKYHAGVVKSFNTLNNYGFIECEEVKTEYGFDVFVHGRGLESAGTQLHVGQIVHFEVGLSPKGQPQALNIQVLPDDGKSAAEHEEALKEEEPAPKRQKFEDVTPDPAAGISANLAHLLSGLEEV